MISFTEINRYPYTYTRILHSSFYRESGKEILRTIFYRDFYKREFAESYLVFPLFTTRVALVLLACGQ